jgi:hypothetical protein
MTDPAPDIGSTLRQARIRRGQSLEVVQQQTRIPRKMLEALETNRFEEFPAVVYLRGFLKNYCDHLDVEFEPLWSQMDPKKIKPSPEAAPPKEEAHAPKTPAAHQERAARDGSSEADGPNSAQLLPFLLIGGLLAAGISAWLLGSRKPAPVEQTAAAQPPREIAPIHTPKEMGLRIVARQDSWLQLQTDGVLRFQGRAPAGLALEWKAMDAFLLRTKDPSSISVLLDGAEIALTDGLKTASGDYKIVRP